jgi:hypothetical protein
MRKTLYVRDEDEPIWGKARELFGETLAPTISRSLAVAIQEKEADLAKEKGFERIEVRYDDSENARLPTAKAFVGRWIFPPTKPIRMTDEGGPVGDAHSVAITAKGNIVVYSWKIDETDDSHYGFRFHVYKTFEEAAHNDDDSWAAREAFEAVGVPVQELDI